MKVDKLGSLIDSISNSINNSSELTTRRKVKSIINFLGNQRLTQKVVDSFNHAIKKSEIKPDMELELGMSNRLIIHFSLKKNIRKKPVPTLLKLTSEKKETPKQKKIDKLVVPDDFMYHLFDFESELEYERFQACLDSNHPIGIFLIPKGNDFFSSIIEKVLSLEVVRKRQYAGDGAHIGKISKSNLNDTEDSMNEEYNSHEDLWQFSDIHSFGKETLDNVIIGSRGKELIDSEKFEIQFNQLSLYSNKYYNDNQFFLLFNCPSIQRIKSHNKIKNLDDLISKVTQKLPYTFKLTCKFESEAELINSKEIRNKIVAHFKTLFEVPSYQIEDIDSDLYDIFIELQKAQVQAENQFLWNIDKEKFFNLKWGYESNEHIYLKYFAINTLSNTYYSYSLDSISCEHSKSKNDNPILRQTDYDKYRADNPVLEQEDYNRYRVDVYAEDKNKGNIYVEVETLRGKDHLGLLGNMITKANAWVSDKYIKELWLIVPGFEIARNYYQLSQIQKLLDSMLEKIFGKKIDVKIFLPDFIKKELTEVDFSTVYSPTYKISTNKKIVPGEQNGKKPVVGFANVVGLHEEKEILLKLKSLQDDNYNLGFSGVLFFGLPGCGKTYLANAFAEELNRTFLSFTPADITSMWIGKSQKNIKDIFAQAKAKSPSILFIDELESIAFNRNVSEFSAHSDQKATINQLLIEINNACESNVLVIGATNLPSMLDPAIKRSGRFDFKIPILPPDIQERKEMFELYFNRNNSEVIKNQILLNPNDFKEIGQLSYHFTSSDIKSFSNRIRMEQILGKAITFNFIKNEIEKFRKGQLSLNEPQVRNFIEDCKISGIEDTPKIINLKKEWGITSSSIGYKV